MAQPEESTGSITMLLKAQNDTLHHLEDCADETNRNIVEMNGKLAVYFLGIKPEDHVKHHVFFAATEDRFTRLEERLERRIDDHSRDILELKAFMWKAMGIISVFSSIPVLNTIWHLLKGGV
jgi:hypothetical protein